MRTMEIQGEQIAKAADALGRVPLFASLKPDDLVKVLGAAKMAAWDDGEVVMSAGAAASAFLVILSGKAAVQVPTEDGEALEVAVLERPACVGEMGLIRGTEQSATVLARGALLALSFSAQAFHQMFNRVPGFGLAICQELANRVAATTSKLPGLERGAEPVADVLSLLPLGFIQRHRVLPLMVDGNRLTVGFVDEPDPRALAGLAQMLPSFELRKVHIGADLFNDVLSTHGAADGWQRDSAVAATQPKGKGSAGSSPRLDSILSRLVDEGGSDLHLSAGHRPRWRIDGEIREITDAPILGENEVYELIAPVLRSEERDKFQATFDLDFAHAIRGVARFRGSIFADHRGAGAVFRVIPDKILTAEQLGLPPVVATLCDHPKGLILVTGPTGSGKSTTLAAMIDRINKTRSEHIITMEDPIEFVHDSHRCLINQREMGRHSMGFSAALKGALRQDPDIVLLGELRDRETIELALETANTGHLVFGTLHTSTAISTIERVVNVFPADMQDTVRAALAECLKGVIAQCLCKRVGGGRIAGLEVLVVDFAVQNLIRADKTHQIATSMATGIGRGNQVLNAELARLVNDNKVAYEEALSKAVDKADLAKRLGRALGAR